MITYDQDGLISASGAAKMSPNNKVPAIEQDVDYQPGFLLQGIALLSSNASN